MSYKCGICGEAMGKYQKPTMVTVETRQKIYPVRKDTWDNMIDKGGVGTEIVKELKFCPTCLALAGNVSSDTRAPGSVLRVIAVGHTNQGVTFDSLCYK